MAFLFAAAAAAKILDRGESVVFGDGDDDGCCNLEAAAIGLCGFGPGLGGGGEDDGATFSLSMAAAAAAVCRRCCSSMADIERRFGSFLAAMVIASTLRDRLRWYSRFESVSR